MAHLAISPAKDADTFTPLTKAYNRTGKDGAIPQVNFLMGSQYNIRIDGDMSISASGNIVNDTASAITGKLEIAGESSDGTEIEKLAAFSSFMYFYPGLKIVGNSEIQDADVGAGPIPVQRIRHVFEDLATADNVIIDLQGGDGNAQLVLRETVDGVETDLVTTEITTGVINIKWELAFQEDGITKLYYLEPSGSRTRIYNGTLTAKLGESKATVKLMSDQQAVKTVKSDYMIVYYPNINMGYDVPITSRLAGRIKVWDTDNEALEADWVQVEAGDHDFTGERVVENGFVRCWFTTAPSMKLYGWNVALGVWELTTTVIPKSSQNDLATTLQDVVFRIYNDSFVKLNVKYGIVDHILEMHRGMPYVRICSSSKEFRINTTAPRMALSVGTTATQIQDFNQDKTDDANRGNPLNLSPTANPFTFTNDSNATTGLLLMDDNWMAWYDETDATNTVGWIGWAKRPTGCIVTATSSTALEKIEWTFDALPVICLGILESDPSTTVSGVPLPFDVGANIDENVKWRANEGIFGYNQKGFLRRKR